MLVKPKDFVPWRGRVNAIISRDYPVLSLQDEPKSDAENQAQWVSADAKAKWTINLYLGDSALPKTGELVDGNCKRAIRLNWPNL